MTDNDGAEWDECLWQFQHLSHFSGTVFVRIKTCPDCTKSKGIGCKEDVFSGCRAVLNPESLSWALQRLVHVATYDDGQRHAFDLKLFINIT